MEPGAAARCFITRRRNAAWEICALGLGGNPCQAELPWLGLAAAHGQITERNYSVARMAIDFSDYQYPGADAVFGWTVTH